MIFYVIITSNFIFYPYFCRHMDTSFIKKHIRNSGFAMLCLGVVLLLLGYAFGWTDHNAFTLSAAALVVLGAALHVYLMKKESKYWAMRLSLVLPKATFRITKGRLWHAKRPSLRLPKTAFCNALNVKPLYCWCLFGFQSVMILHTIRIKIMNKKAKTWSRM